MPTKSRKPINEIQRIISKWAGKKEDGKVAKYTEKDKSLKIMQCPMKPLPDELYSHIEEIEELIISETELHGKTIEMIGGMISLKSLHLEKIDFPENSLPNWKKLICLNSIKLNFISITELPDWICELNNLELLDISNTQIKKLPEKIFGNLKHLCVRSTPLTYLPDVEKQIMLITLDISSTQISKIPDSSLSNALEELYIAQCEFSELPPKVSTLSVLKELNIAGSKISTLPNKMNSASSLRRIDLSYTSIKELPDWLAETVNLKFLGLVNCKLNTLSNSIINHLLKIQIPFIDDVGTDKDNGVYIRQLKLGDMDVRYFKENNKKLIGALLEESAWSRSHEMKIIVMGDKGSGKTTFISNVFDIANDEMIDAYGLKAVDARTEINEYSKNKLDRNTHLTIWELSAKLEDQLVHPVLITDEALYIIVLDSRDNEKLYQRAIYWIKFIENQTLNASVIFVLGHVTNIDSDMLNIGHIQSCSDLRIHEEVYRLFQSDIIGDDYIEESRKNIVQSREALITIIKEMPMYENKIPSSWKRIKRHTQALLEARNLISYRRFKGICRYYTVESEEIIRGLMKWLSEIGIAFFSQGHDTTQVEFIYHALWFARGIYSIVSLSNGKQRSMTLKTLKGAMGNDLQEYSIKNLNDILEIAEDHGLCFKKEEEFIFPFTKSLLTEKKHNMHWIKNIYQDRYTNHYMVKCPILTIGLLSSIIVKIKTKIINDRNIECNMNDIVIGREGILVSFHEDRHFAGGSLMVTGDIGCPSYIHIYTLLKKEYFTSQEASEQAYYANYALISIREAYNELTGIGAEQFDEYIEIKQGDKKTYISFTEINGYILAGRRITYSSELQKELNIYELFSLYFPYSPLRLE